MNTLAHIRTVLRHPSIIRPYRPLLLLSHMRANTSLLGHILGENPEIDGYYELHIGYHSWRSLIHQKLVYFKSHDPKPSARYLFDKVLTNEHGVKADILNNGKLIFALRPPQRTIRSIVNLYRKEFPRERFASVEGATRYYIDRLSTLKRISDRASAPFLYLDSDVLRSDTDRTLESMTSYLELDQPLSTHYSSKPLTGQRRAGDSSSNISLGHISNKQQDYSSIEIDDTLLQDARQVFEDVRGHLVKHPMAAASVLQS